MKNEFITQYYQFTVTLPNIVGELGKLTGIFANNNINVLGLTVTPVGDYSLVRFTTDASSKVVTSYLQKAGYTSFVDTVYGVKVLNKPGIMHKLIKAISASGYNINLVFGAASQDDQHATLIINTGKVPFGSSKLTIQEVLDKQFGRLAVA